MAIYIKGVELPTNCLICPFTEKDDRMGTICYFTNIVALNIGRQEDCPLTEILEPHGRLIDADALKCYGIHIGDEYEDKFHDYQWVDRSDIDNAPTVIERSEQ